MDTDGAGRGGKKKTCDAKSVQNKGSGMFELWPSKSWLFKIGFHHPVPLPMRAHPSCVTERRARPASSFVHPGMWDILTSWLFIDSAQLRVFPPWLFLSVTPV